VARAGRAATHRSEKALVEVVGGIGALLTLGHGKDVVLIRIKQAQRDSVRRPVLWDKPQEIPHFENSLTSRLFGAHRGRTEGPNVPH